MSIEQDARDLLERLGVETAQSFSAGDVVELANLLAERRRAVAAMREMAQQWRALAQSNRVRRDNVGAWHAVALAQARCADELAALAVSLEAPSARRTPPDDPPGRVRRPSPR